MNYNLTKYGALALLLLICSLVGSLVTLEECRGDQRRAGQMPGSRLQPHHVDVPSSSSKTSIRTIAIARQQIGAPIAIARVESMSEDATVLAVDYATRNMSGRLIKAYTIGYRYTTTDGATEGGGLLVEAVLDSEMFAPEEERPDSIEDLVSEVPIEMVELYIDFVRFADGSEWGDDARHSSETLHGQEAGEAAVAQRLARVLAYPTIEADSLLEGLQSGQFDGPPMFEGNVYWLTGYQRGQNFIKARLKSVLLTDGVTGLRNELPRFAAQSNRR